MADGDLEITEPQELQVVIPPVRVAWRTDDLPTSASRYAVFIDRVPIHPGQNLRAVSDESCKATQGCPDAGYLRTRGIYLTDRPEIEIPFVAQIGGLAGRDKPSVHRATIVLIDADGDRVGERAYQVRFRVADEAS